MNSCWSKKGFTLIEITVAVSILSLALVALLGLQSKMVDTYYSEASRVKASFIAQYMMTMLEVDPEPPETGIKEGDLVSRLDEIGFFHRNEKKEQEKPYLNWTYRQDVQSFDLPLFKDAMREVRIDVKWGRTENETFSLIYYINTVGMENN